MGGGQHPPVADEAASADMLSLLSQAYLSGPLPGGRHHAPNDADLWDKADHWWRDGWKWPEGHESAQQAPQVAPL